MVRTKKYSESVELIVAYCRQINRKIGLYQYHSITKDGNFQANVFNGYMIIPLHFAAEFNKEAMNTETIIMVARSFVSTQTKRSSLKKINEAWNNLFQNTSSVKKRS